MKKLLLVVFLNGSFLDKFKIYINDLKSFNELLADDTKVLTILDDMSKVEILKDVLNTIYKWTCD